MKCEHVGMNSAIHCQKHKMTFSHGFPNHEKAQISKSEEIFGLDFLTGKELELENDGKIIALCKNNDKLDAWLDAVSKKTFHFSGYNKVGCTEGPCLVRFCVLRIWIVRVLKNTPDHLYYNTILV